MMKKSLNRLLFSLRISIKQLISSPFKTCLLIIGFTGVFMGLILAMSMKDFFFTYYYHNLEEKYQNFDLTIGVAPSGNARFFSISQMSQNEALAELTNDYAPFFEFEILLETDDSKKVYVHTYASSFEQFSKISVMNVEDSIQLEHNELIITKSLADQLNVDVLDEVYLNSRDIKKTFIIKEILLDGHMFTDASIYIDKEIGLPFFLSAISPTLENLPANLLRNMYNKVYIDISDNNSIEDYVEVITKSNAYEQLEYTMTIDMKAINQFVERNFSVFLLVLSIVMIAIIFVLQTTLLIFFNEKKSLFSTIHMLGGRKYFSLRLILFEMIFIFTISFVLGLIITKAVINFGLKYLRASTLYIIKTEHILITLVIGALIVLSTIIVYFIKQHKTSDIKEIKDVKEMKHVNMRRYIIYIITYVILFFLVRWTSWFDFISIEYRALVQLVLGFLGVMTTMHLLFKKKAMAITVYKKHNYHLKMLINQHSFKHFVNLSLISFLTILLLVLANHYMIYRYQTFENEYKVDFVLSQITRNYDLVFDQTTQLENVDSAHKAILINDVKIEAYHQNISELVSMDKNALTKYFNVELDSEMIERFSDDQQLNILLPSRYAYLYHLDIGDQVTVYVDGKYQEQDFIIQGFFDKHLGNLAFANLNILPDTNYNVIFVNGNGDKEALKDELFNNFSKELIAVVDVNQSISKLLFDMERVTTYITMVLSIIILCFLAALINQMSLLFQSMKNHYGKLIMLGSSRSALVHSLIGVFMIIFVFVYLLTVILYIVSSQNLAFIGVIFGEYEPIAFSFYPILSGGLIIALTYSFILFIYLQKVNKINIDQNLRNF